ncbi:uncharacterized protein LOC129768802 [Toxorhynchites rutilus septentrionalis]|uniref:uncharacterized protein LOC129768802 n=1 Tax=Toxorhynchites rutilus septentrionalis TaxID=329112 RepID=UPI002478F524|nr:uncharacterized protein LOC129768802 [Toxorhynchites rutilus septentrionalis]
MKDTTGLKSLSSAGRNSKSEQRLERKKRKILALAEMMQLNEQNRTQPSSAIAKPPENQADSLDPTVVVNGSKQEEPDEKKLKLADIDYRTLKVNVNKKRDRMRNVPKLRLKEIGEEALLKTKPEDRVPLILDDIQALLMQIMLRADSPMSASRWVVLEKSAKLTHTTVLFVEGLNADDFVTYESSFKECRKIFHNPLEVVTPSDRIVDELACIPLSDTHKDILLAEYGSLEAAMLSCKDHLLIRKSIFNNIDSITDDSSEDCIDIDLPPGDRFPRTQLLLSPVQMINEDYPLPLTGSLKHRYAGYITTNDHYAPVTPRSPMFALDCEMCKTSIGASELTRVSIIDEEGKEFYETLVRPENKIVDYVTQFSGITPEILRNVSKTLRDVHVDLKNKLPPDAILVGQSLNFDLNALKMMHPYVIDTSMLFNVTGKAGTKTKLKVLAKTFLHKDIQCSSGGHNSIEDCRASLELVKHKLSKDIYYGDQCLLDRQSYHKRVSKIGIATKEDVESLGVASPNECEISATLFGHARSRNKTSSIVTNADNLDNFRKYFGDSVEANGGAKKLLSFEKLATDAAVVNQTVATCINHDFNLCCIQLKEQDLSSGEAKRAKIEQIDGWIRNLFDALSTNGLLMVLLAGGEVNRANRMAVAMLQIRRG